MLHFSQNDHHWCGSNVDKPHNQKPMDGCKPWRLLECLKSAVRQLEVANLAEPAMPPSGSYDLSLHPPPDVPATPRDAGFHRGSAISTKSA